MKPYVVVLVFMALVLSSAVTGIGSYRRTAHAIDQDLHQALSKTLMEKRSDRITADTIRTYRQYLTIEELRERAYLAMKVTRRDGQSRLEMVGSADCSMATIYQMSDQRLSYVLMLAAILWMVFCYRPSSIEEDFMASSPSIVLGGLTYSYSDQSFYHEGSHIHLTPMQQQLLTMFFEAKDHRLSKQDICEVLWPKKEDPSETLYTLIRRVKPIIEKEGIRIESDRGRAYYLTVNPS